MKNIFLVINVFLVFACKREPMMIIEEGVSQELARYRKENIKDVTYDLSFTIPGDQNRLLMCSERIRFTMQKEGQLILDYKDNGKGFCLVNLDGNKVDYRLEHEHLVIEHVAAGLHEVELAFCVNNHSLNRREEFMYTLLVPDRARTLFPCFDQPDMKASYQLSLTLPVKWTAIANSPAVKDTLENGFRKMEFAPTEPLSTYLFSFVAGVFTQVEQERDGRVIKLYHRETDPSRLQQIPIIYDQVYASINWLEEYTGVSYPFAKYDLVILPGFQYGGMEHTGATLYNDTRMFLSVNASLQEELERTKLIAHETAHMWFGDYVTMGWFNEVWMKEVFANYFASKMTEPHFPDLNHDLTYTHAFFPVAYSEDRTMGANAIIQHLPNLKDAGLIYGSIIYNKTPIVMSMLIEKIGEDAFRKSIQTYLKRYAYDNASWNDLITIIDSLTPYNMHAWNKAWMECPGRPKGNVFRVENKVQIKFLTQNERREQTLQLMCVNESTGAFETMVMQLPKETICSSAEDFNIILPNSNGKAYGYWQMDTVSMNYCLHKWTNIPSDVCRMAMLINMFEAVCEGDLSARAFFSSLTRGLLLEENRLVRISAINYLQQVAWKLYPLSNAQEEQIWTLVLAQTNRETKQRLFQLYMTVYNSPQGTKRLWDLLADRENKYDIVLGERDVMTLCYELALRDTANFDAMLGHARKRIKSIERKKEFDYTIMAVNPSQEQRDTLFMRFLAGEERDIEPWCQRALGYLNHPLRQQHGLAYIRPALEALVDVQRTGDIFFPKGWIQSVLKGHNSVAASDTVKQFLQENPDYPQLMKNKILQSAGHLVR